VLSSRNWGLSARLEARLFNGDSLPNFALTNSGDAGLRRLCLAMSKSGPDSRELARVSLAGMLYDVSNEDTDR
jgi:hypothetical protein